MEERLFCDAVALPGFGQVVGAGHVALAVHGDTEQVPDPVSGSG
jgi:hypothetical protein